MEMQSDWKKAWKNNIAHTRSDALHKMAELSADFNKTEIFVILSSEYGSEWLPLLRLWWDQLHKEPESDGEALQTRRRLRELFDSMYDAKAKEVTGKDGRPDGTPFHPKWGAKENALLKQDFEHYGEHTLRQMFVLFFKDAVTQVANFTRYKTQAGYTYPVFHGSISKLEMSTENAEACPHCGQIKGHADSCPIIQEMRQRDHEWKEEVRKEQENYEGPDITELFKERLHGEKK